MLNIRQSIGLYRENAIAVERGAKYPFGGNAYYVTMNITLPMIPEFTRNERNTFIVTYYILPPLESAGSFWMTRSQRSRRRDKGLLQHILRNLVAEIIYLLQTAHSMANTGKIYARYVVWNMESTTVTLCTPCFVSFTTADRRDMWLFGVSFETTQAKRDERDCLSF